ncbi:MAG TPA: porin family protein [Chitinophagales bacterium]|nr:porin family protein [Chitinophagales bacterium]
MKKNYNCILILLLIISASQQLSGQYVTFGRAFSFGDAFITDKDVSHGFLLSLTGGLSITYADNEHYGFAADVVYATEGSNSKTAGVAGDIQNKTKLGYIRIPFKYIRFLGKYGDPIRPKIFVGPSFGYLVLAETNRDNSISDFNKFDMGLLIGVGANKIICDRIWLNTDITYTQGILDVTKQTPLNDEINLNGSVRLKISLLLGTNRK